MIEDQVAEGDRVVTRWRATAGASPSLVPTASSGPSPRCAGITIVSAFSQTYPWVGFRIGYIG
jgi:hypothetical protein